MQSEGHTSADISIGNLQTLGANAQVVLCCLELPNLKRMIRDLPRTVEGLKAKVRELLEFDQPFVMEWKHIFKDYIIILDDDDLLMAREYVLRKKDILDHIDIRVTLKK